MKVKYVIGGSGGSGSFSGQPVSLQLIYDDAAYAGSTILFARVSYDILLSKVRLGAIVAPTGASLIIDTNYHATAPASATSIFNSIPFIAASSFTGQSTALKTTTLAEGGFLLVDFDQIGSTVPGSNIMIEYIGTLI